MTTDLPAILIVGAGLSGAVIARRLAEQGRASLVIDHRPHLGGNCYDEKVDGITIHRYGAHIFHTDHRDVWDFLSRFTSWRPYTHHVQALVQDQLIPLPFNLNSLDICFPPDQASKIQQALIAHFGKNARITILDLQKTTDLLLKKLADFVYEHVFLHYTLKQWGCRLEDLDYSVAARVPVVVSRDDRYFTNKFQGIPATGYTQMITNILDHPLINLRLSTGFSRLRAHRFQHIYFTGAIDFFFQYQFGELPYRSLRFVTKNYDQKYYQTGSVINYPETKNYTRIIEHKYFLDEKAPQTTITFEYPKCFTRGEDERYYPIQNPDSQKLYTQYLQLAATRPDVTFLGRLGDFRYYDMDAAVKRALELPLASPTPS